MWQNTEMPPNVKPTRRYNSTRRREQAAATRLDILEAAQRLFERDGYATTTMAAIAAEARVALKTVYVAFETKSGVLRALWNLGLRGEENEDRPISEQPWYREVLTEPDPERQLRLNARNSRAGKLRIGALAEVIRSAAPIDPDIATLWARIGSDYLANQRAIVNSLNDKGALRPDLDPERATDVLWTLNHPDVWQLLVSDRGWTPDQYERWCADVACLELLNPSAERNPVGANKRKPPRNRTRRGNTATD
jgi:AcrR family transcriptional regulator